MMAESTRIQDELLRVTVLGAGQKMRAATKLLESGGGLPSEEQLATAAVLCSDAGRLLESAFQALLAVLGGAIFDEKMSA